MAQKMGGRSKALPRLDQRLTNIESKLQVIENYMNESKININNFERIYNDLEEIKQNTKAKSSSRKKRKKPDEVESIKTKNHTVGLDLSPFENLLQNPMIRTFLKKSLNLEAPLVK